MEPNAKLKRRFGQIEDHDQIQVNEASRSYKMQESKMADLSVVKPSYLIFFQFLFLEEVPIRHIQRLKIRPK